jgi:hypothetical protein
LSIFDGKDGKRWRPAEREEKSGAMRIYNCVMAAVEGLAGTGVAEGVGEGLAGTGVADGVGEGLAGTGVADGIGEGVSFAFSLAIKASRALMGVFSEITPFIRRLESRP